MAELTVATRWAALCLSLVAMALGTPTKRDLLGAAALAVYAVVRTVWPLPSTNAAANAGGIGRWAQGRALVAAGAELALAVVVVGITGYLGSPFIISLGAAAFIAGRALPAWGVVSMAVAGIAVLTGMGLEGADTSTGASQAVERLAVLAALSLLGSYSEWLLRKGGGAQGEELKRLRDLNEVNHLLLELHARAASVPASLSLKAAVANTVSRLRSLLGPDFMVLLLSDPVAEQANGVWEVALADGVAFPEVIAGRDLPPALREATESLGPVCRSKLSPGEGAAAEATSGVYVPLWARGALVGLLAAERAGLSRAFGTSDLGIVDDVARHAGLAIDNARWFRRLRSLGAEEERGRIARELHDRVGQSLAYVAISLDRMVNESKANARAYPSADVGPGVPELEELAAAVRAVAREIRTKLSDLRAELSEGGDLRAELAAMLERMEQRAGIAGSLSCHGEAFLPPAVERAVARIAQEALSNVERHSGASHVKVHWHCDGCGAQLEVADDGRGTPAMASLRQDAFGILGMRERADAIGATLAIGPAPAGGTTVRLRLGRPAGPDRRLG